LDRARGDDEEPKRLGRGKAALTGCAETLVRPGKGPGEGLASGGDRC